MAAVWGLSSSTQNLAAWLPAVARRCPAAFHRALLMRMCFRLLTLVAPEHGPTRDARRIFGRMARAISFGRIRGGSSSGSSEDAEDCKSSMADPKFYPPEFGMEEGAPGSDLGDVLLSDADFGRGANCRRPDAMRRISSGPETKVRPAPSMQRHVSHCSGGSNLGRPTYPALFARLAR